MIDSAFSNMLSQTQLQSMAHYSPDTGEFVWLQITTSRVKIGDVAGAVNSGGYISIGLYGRRYYAHRLAWLYVTGCWPKAIIDHRDRQRHNNRFSNLRLATDTENAHNASPKKNNISGVSGVSWCKQSGKWQAKICVHRRQMYLGLFETIDEAAGARLAAQATLHPAFTSVGTNPSR